ncbi:hypothetical protein WDZ92_01415 [Nostoc sp. NIES-2111]
MTLLQKRGACLASTLFCLLLFLMSLRAHAQCTTGCNQTIALAASWSNTNYTVSGNNSTVCITGSNTYYVGTIDLNNRPNTTVCIGPTVRFANSTPFTNMGSNFQIINYGTYDPAIVLDNKFVGFDNYGTTAGSISVTHNSATFNFRSGASMGYQSITVSAGTFNNYGSLGSPINTLTISGGSFSSTGAVNTNTLALSAGSFTNSGSTQINNAFTVSGGSMTTTGSLTVSPTFTPSAGTLNLNGTNTFNNTVTINSGVSATFGGATSITTLNIGSGGNATFNGALSLSGNTTISSTGATLTANAGYTGGTITVQSGSTFAFQGAVNLSSQLINSGTVRVPTGASTSCNTVSTASGISNGGTITAPSASPMTLGSTPSGAGSVGTYVSVAAVPANQPTALSVTPGSDRRMVSGSFTAASGTPAAAGYVVLRRLGSAITSSNYPRSGQVATTGSYLNSCKVVARLASGTTTFSDQVDSCGTYYYAVVSSSSSTSGSCATYTTTSSTSGNTNTATPLYNSIAYPQTTYCPNTSSGAGVITGATGGSFTTNKTTLNINATSGVMSAPSVITDTGSTTVTYTVPARNGCTAFSSTSTVRMSGSALAYVWNGGASGSLATAASWNPSRSVLNSCDILVVKNGGSVALSSASTQSFRQLRITNNTNLTLTAASAATLTLTGQTGVGLFIEAGSSLTINTSNLSLKLGNNTVAVINGTLNLSSGVLDASGSNVRLYFGSTSSSFVPLTRTSGTLTTGTTTHLQFGYTGATAMANFTLPNGLFTTNPSSVRALTLMTATATLSLGNQKLIVTDSLRQPSGSGKFILNGNQLTLQGVAVGNPQIDGSAAGSKLSLEGLRDLSGIRFASTNLARLRMNRTYARAMTLPVGADLTITDSIVFVKGIINTGVQKITVATTANLGAENDSSYVYGTLEQQRTLAQNSASAFSNMRISINALGAAPGLTSVTRYNASRTDLGAGTYGTALKYIIHTASTANLNATLTVRLLNSELGGIAPSKLIFARQATGSSVWQPYTGTQKNVAALTYTLTGIGGFSTWTLGDETSGVLPVSLTSFTGKQLSPGRNLLNWITASEENSRGFTVLRSEDGEAYDSLAFVASQLGQAAHHTRYYAYTDNTAPEVAYYRLRQTDYDGRNQTFQPVKIGDAVALKSDALTLYPNPITEDQFTLAYHGKVSTTCDVRLTTQNGRELMHRQYNLVPGWEKMIGLPPLPKGIYILELRLPSGQMLPVRVVRE